MTQPIEVWFEFASTYSYPAVMQVEQAANDAGVAVVWRPFLLGPVFAAQGLTASPFTVYPVKGAYMWRDMARVCAAAGLEFTRPTEFPRGSILAARIAVAHDGVDWLADFLRATYVANFAQDRDVAQADVVSAILTDLGLDAPGIVAGAGTDAAKHALRDQTDAAMTRGIFGAPSFMVGDDLFWGHDRMAMAIEAARTQ